MSRGASTGRAAALVVLAVLTSCSGSADSPDSLLSGVTEPTRGVTAIDPLADPTLPYPERIDLVEALAREYPGVIEDGHPLGDLGLWAGIHLQTEWQDESGRNAIPHWRLMNYGLSVEPTIYAREYEAAAEIAGAGAEAVCASSPYARVDPGPGTDDPAISRVDVCEAWTAYFIAATDGTAAAELQALMWDAHTMALINRLREVRGELDESRAGTPEEFNLWANWIETVFLLDASEFSTQASTSATASEQFMPPGSPVGSEGCRVDGDDLGSSEAFVAALVARPGSIERIFERYAAVEANPTAATAAALADPTLAPALAAYLGAGDGAAANLTDAVCASPIGVALC